VIAALVILFFIVIWVALMLMFSRLTKSHSWILPIFAVGVGAPRWCQMLWATSGAGSYLPWVASATGGAILSRCLWLWLGVLDAIQGVGFGMILLQTMTRFHIVFTLMAAQFIGSIFTILARATAPDNTGPGTVFPNFALGAEGLKHAGFWLGLIFQIIVCIGFAIFFRKEQLTKP
jgi:alpha-1,3-glucan synthase